MFENLGTITGGLIKPGHFGPKKKHLDLEPCKNCIVRSSCSESCEKYINSPHYENRNVLDINKMISKKY